MHPLDEPISGLAAEYSMVALLQRLAAGCGRSVACICGFVD
jgi:hypothetical protein